MSLASLRRIDQAILAERPDGHSLDGTPGDCFRACLAMLAGTELHEAPHAVMHLSWYSVARRFIRSIHGNASDLQCYEWDGSFDLYGDGIERPVIAAGPSPRGPFKHCVIANSVTGELVHDPHPSRAGLTAIELADAIVPLTDTNMPLDPILALGGAR